MSEFTCDECGTEVADGHAHYIGASHRRYCGDCARADYAKRYGTYPIDEVLYAEHHRGGSNAVYDYVRACHSDWGWERCEPCDDHTPTWEDVCAVCLTVRPTTVTARRWQATDPAIAYIARPVSPFEVDLDDASKFDGDCGDETTFALGAYEIVSVVSVDGDQHGGWISQRALYFPTNKVRNINSQHTN